MNSTKLYKKLLRAMADSNIEIPEKGFKTAREWAVEFQCGMHHISKMAKRLAKLGKCEVKMFRVKQINGLVSPTPHYKFTA